MTKNPFEGFDYKYDPETDTVTIVFSGRALANEKTRNALVEKCRSMAEEAGVSKVDVVPRKNGE